MPVVLDADRISRTLTRIAHEILERNRGVDELALVGIRTRGVPLARRLARIIGEVSRHEVPTGALDITLYRDDLMRTAVGAQPLIRKTEIPFSIDDKRILLVDDVLYTGRTIRAALDALIEFGRPKAIQLVVLFVLARRHVLLVAVRLQAFRKRRAAVIEPDLTVALGNHPRILLRHADVTQHQ